MYAGMVLAFSILSLVVAVPLGALAAYAITGYLAQLINFNLAPFRVPPRALALELAVGIVVPLVAALPPLINGVRITVREAIASYGVADTFGRGWADRVMQQVRGLPRPLLLSLRNTFRRKARLVLTLSTLILGGAIFIAIFSVRASLLQSLDEFTAYLNYDVAVDFDGAYQARQIERRALAVPGVVAAETWGGSNARRVRPGGQEGSSFELVAPPADTALLRPVLVAGRWLRPDDHNAVVIDTDVLKNEPDLRVGDEVVLVIERKETTWHVVGIAQTALSATFIRIGTAYVAYDDLLHAVGAAPLASRVRVQTAQHDAATQRATAAALQTQYDNAAIGTVSVRTTTSIRDAIAFQFNVLVVFLGIIAALLALVGALGLMGTMSMNVHERAREIGVMRAIGASNGAVLQIFMVEGVLIGALSWLPGALLAVPISQALSHVVGTEFAGTPLSYVFAANGALGWLVAVCVLAALASFWPAWNAVRLSVRDVLAYE
jgi:putative ABC transport system permease protein